MARIPMWLTQDDVLGYIVNCYAGVDEVPDRPGMMRRVFLWEEEGEVKMGNAEAFTLHLGRRLGRKLRPGDATLVHALLRELGETLSAHRSHRPPREDSPRAGRFKQPAPEEWVVTRKGKPRGAE